MGNKITHLTTVKTFAVIASSPLRVDLSCSGAFIIVELSELISDSDIHMTALALELCCTLMSDKRSSPSAGLAVRNKVLPQALTLIKSSLLQEQVLLALQNFFAALVYSANTISANVKIYDLLIEIDESCDERVPEPLIPSLNEEPYAPLLLER
ncbi:cullin-associated NEDD8-dissociated protein 1-like [Arachis hypogaea]|uniref:cullin-associated NEDD8-dissociated protein 1-like n=1 Tax=Arachis hypogaea TaxID=3818 RepID=UPI003B217116